MFSIFQNRKSWSKWTPITVYTHSFEDNLLLGRICSITGDVQFKSLRVHGNKKYTQACGMFDKPYDANKQLTELLKEKT